MVPCNVTLRLVLKVLKLLSARLRCRVYTIGKNPRSKKRLAQSEECSVYSRIIAKRK